MDITDVRQMTPEKMREALKAAYRDLTVTRFHVKTGQNKNTAEIKNKKKLIAQILTILNAKKK